MPDVAVYRWIAVAALTAVLSPPAACQFFDLATNDDGSVVYFATKHSRVGANEPDHGRIFRIRDGELELVESREVEPPGNSNISANCSNFFDLQGPVLAGDESVFAFAAGRSCSCPRACATFDFESVVQTGTEEVSRGTGFVQLSRDGAFALFYPGRGQNFTPRLVDLRTRTEMGPVSLGRIGLGGTTLSNVGAIVHVAFDQVALTRGAATTALSNRDVEIALDAVVDADATQVAYISHWVEPSEAKFSRLRRVSVGNGEALTLAEGPGAFFAPRISADGSRVLFLSTAPLVDTSGPPIAQAYTVESDATGIRQLTYGTAGVSSAVLSGDGRIVYAVTGAGALVKIDAESGMRETLVPRTAALGGTHVRGRASTFVVGIAKAGSLSVLEGAGLVDEPYYASGFPLPERLGGFRLSIDGQAVPLVSVTPSEAIYQAPWDLEEKLGGADLAEFTIETNQPESASVFDGVTQAFRQTGRNRGLAVAASTGYPESILRSTPRALATDQDYSLVTEENPLRPGGIAHAYAVGLGSVVPAVPLGHPAPVDGPLSRVAVPITCTASSFAGGAVGRQILPLLFAGLAPGLVGVYQVSLEVPATLRSTQTGQGLLEVQCRPRQTFGDSDFVFHFPFEFPFEPGD